MVPRESVRGAMGERRQGAVMQNNDGRLDSVVAGQDGVLHHCWQRVAGAAFGGWWVINGPWPGCPALVANADGRPESFLLGVDRAKRRARRLALAWRAVGRGDRSGRGARWG